MMKTLYESLKCESVHDDFNNMEEIRQEILKHVGKSVVQPGEGVGVICAQSIGERQTQLSVAYEEPVRVYKGAGICAMENHVGALIDDYFDRFPDYTRSLDNGSEILLCTDLDLKIPMVYPSGSCGLVPIVEMSRHPPHGDLVRVTTASGRSVCTTLSHSHLTWDASVQSIVPIEASKLQVGDRIPVLLKRRTWGMFDILSQGVGTAFSLEGLDTATRDDTALRLALHGKRTRFVSASVIGGDGDDASFWDIVVESSEEKEEEKEDIFMDPICEIVRVTEKEYSQNHRHVYDFSVEGNQTFMMRNGIFVHNTLNSFHSSGLCVATVVTGVPRFLELLNATKEPKMSTNHFQLTTSARDPQHLRDIVGSSLIHHFLHNLVVSETIFLEEKEDEFWYGAYETVFGNQFREYTSGITFMLDVDKIYKHKILLTTVKNRIESAYGDISCVISPLYVGQIDIFTDTSSIQISEEESMPQFLKIKNPVEIYLEEVVKPKLMDVEICGIKGIKNFHYHKDEGVWKIQTEGANLMELLCLPYVDIETVSSNNMWEVYNTMGIEATREFLIEEFTNVVSSDGTFINPSHILLLVDVMTYQGNITSVSRYGMKKEQMGVLSRASFEESLDQFCNAGFYSEKDLIKSVSANIMVGKRSSIGSGLCGLMMDWKQIKESGKQTKKN
jgi:DNA-directed RNA polymerase beta' subunit